MMKRRTIALFLMAAGLFFFSCQKKTSVKGVDLVVNFSEKELSDNLMTDIQYTWKTAADFQKMSEDYCVYVHFWHNTNMLLQDDYFPEIPTSKWEPNKEYTVTHKIYIPPFIDEFDPLFKGQETLKLSIGLYSPYDQSGKSKLMILEKDLKVVPPPPDTPEIVYESGWYEPEADPRAFLKKWRWTAKEAKCLIDNPHRDALLIIKGGVNMDTLKDQKVMIKINDTILDEFIPSTSDFEKSYSLKKEALGDKSEFDLIIATDQTFVPAKVDPNSKDQRELGLQVSFLYFR